MTKKTPFAKPAPKSVQGAPPKGHPVRQTPHFKPVKAPGKPKANR